MKQIDISVNVCTYNRAEMLRGALESLICQKTDGKFSYEIVVVDNASTDDTKAVVKQVSKNSPVPIRYIFEENKGVAQARNRGVKGSQGAWIAFFDDDQFAEADWLRELYSTALLTRAPIVGGAVHVDLPTEQATSAACPRVWAPVELVFYLIRETQLIWQRSFAPFSRTQALPEPLHKPECNVVEENILRLS